MKTMSLKQLLIVVGLVVVFNGILVFSGALDKLANTEKQTTTKQVDADVVDLFRATLEDEVVEKIGQPIEGFEPQMFLQAFPGLVETDFEGVEASIGFYTIRNGRLVHDTSDGVLIHSAAGAIGRPGMETLLNNVADRSGINIREEGTITDIMGVITAN